MPGSASPERVPITKPSSGVKPRLVSTERPRSTAVIEQPLPRWQVMSRYAAGAPPWISANRWTT